MSVIAAPLKTGAGQILGCLAANLEKAQAHAEKAGFDGETLVSARLFPDMLPLSSQARIASDMLARGSARLVGEEPGSIEDGENTLPALAARARAALNLVLARDDAALDAGADRTIELQAGGNAIKMPGRQFLVNFMFANAYFHAATAYGILRHNGVPLSKADFLMPPSA